MIADEYTTTGNDVIGVMVFSSLILGKLVHLLSNPVVFIPVILVPLVLLLVLNLIKTVKLAKLAAKEAEEEQIRAVKAELERRRQAQDAAEDADVPSQEDIE